MFEKFLYPKTPLILIIVFLLMGLPLIGLFSNNFFIRSPGFEDSFPLINQPPPDLQSQANLTGSGNGITFDCSENAWGTKIHNNLDESSSISWETPDAWVGNQIYVSISNLRQLISGPLNLQSSGYTQISGSTSGGYAFTHTIGGGSFNWSWVGLTTELNFTLNFQTSVVISTISQLRIYTYSYWTDPQGANQGVDYFIHNFNSGSNENLGQTPQNSPFDWANYTINSGFSNYISSSGEIRIQFSADPTGTFLNPNYFFLDFVLIEIDATQQWITPQAVTMVLNDGTSDYSIVGTNATGTVLISGNWTDNPKYFQFNTSGASVNFDASSTFYISQNKPGNVTSTYYLNTSQPVPAHHLWKLNFYQDPYPSANFTSLNFSLSTLPTDWTLINATDPGSATQILDEISITGGIRLDAEPGDITGSGIWSIYYNSPNYISDLQLRNNSIPLPYNPFLFIWDTLDIQTFFLSPITNGDVNLTISFEGKVNHSQEYNGVSGSNLPFDDWQINSTANKNGTYLITASFFNTTELGIYTIPITVGFPTNLSLLSPDIRYIEFLKGDYINLTVFFENLFYPGNFYDELGIPGANIRWVISNSTGWNDSGSLAPKSDGYYNASLDTGIIGVWDGWYNLTVSANKTHYANQTDSIELLCFETIHSSTAYATNLQWVSGTNYSASVFPNQSLTINLNFTDTYKTPQFIDYANVTAHLYTTGGQILANYNHTGTRVSPGVYQIDFGNLNLSTGIYSLSINSTKRFYSNSSIWVNYTITPLQPLIRVSKISQVNNLTSTYQEWENLTISFKVEYNATIYYEHSTWNAPVNWANVTYYLVPLNGDPLNPSDVFKSGNININPTGIFELTGLHLSNVSGNFAPDNYEIYILCNASDCKERWYNFNLTILAKHNVTLQITRYPDLFAADQMLSIAAKLESSGILPVYLNGKRIYFNFTIYYSSSSPDHFELTDTANTQAVAEINFYLKNHITSIDDVVRIEFIAYFEGYEGFYPFYSFNGAISSQYTMTVTAPVDYTFVIFIVVGAAAGIAAVVIVQRKVLAPKQVQKTQNINYLFTSFKDVVGIQHLFVLLKSTGDVLLQKTYSPEGMDESMERILCTVIANYGKGDQRADAACDLIRFESFTILIDDGDFTRTAVTIGDRPSDKLIRSLVRFVQFFELQNYSILSSTTGAITDLQGVDDLLDLQFGSSLIAPYSISKISKVSGFDETLALMATGLMEDHGYFYLSQLYTRAKSETLIEEMMIFSTIQRLMDKGIIIPYIAEKKPRSVAKKLAATEYDRLKVDLINAKNKALKAVTAGRFSEAVESYHQAASIAASLGDTETKNQFLGKAREYSIKEKPFISVEREAPTFKEPEVAYETISELIPEPITEMPQKPSSLDELRKKSIEITETFNSSITSSTDLLAEEETELTPFEQLTKVHDLMSEGPAISDDFVKEAEMSEEALSLLEDAIKMPEPTPETSSLIDEVIREAESFSEASVPYLPEDLKAKPSKAEEAKIEEILSEIEKQPVTAPSLAETELKNLQNLLSDSKTILSPLPDTLWEFNSAVADLNKMKNKIERHIKQTSTSVMNNLKMLSTRLSSPRKSIEEEIIGVEKELPQIVLEIDELDQVAVKLKKDITSLQKDSKKYKEDLGKAFTKLSSIDKYLIKVTETELPDERQELQTQKNTFNDAMTNLEDIEKELSELNQAIVTLMIEDIEQMMAEEQKTEKLLNTLSKKMKDSKRLQDALFKENSQLNEHLSNLTAIISYVEPQFNSILSAKKTILTNFSALEKDYEQAAEQILKDERKDSLNISAKTQELQDNIELNFQVLKSFEKQFQEPLKETAKLEKIILNMNKRKERIIKALQKAAKFVLAEYIQNQHAFITEIDSKAQPLIQKGYEIRNTLQNELGSITESLYPKIKSLSNELQKISKTAIKQAQKSERVEDEKFFEDLTKSIIIEEETLEFPSEEAPSIKENGVFTDKELGLKQHCPYCNKIISEKVMNLLRKGFEPECSNCGEIIKSKDIQLD